MSLGRGKRYLAWGIFNATFVSIGFVCGIPWGPKGVAISYAVVNYAILYPSLLLAFKDTALRPSDFFQALARPAGASVTAALLLLLLLNVYELSSDLLTVGAGLLTFGSVYLFVLRVLPGGDTDADARLERAEPVYRVTEGERVVAEFPGTRLVTDCPTYTPPAKESAEIQALRAELERERLQVDILLPAEAQRLAAEAQAKGDAAPVMHSGIAAAESLRLVAEAWSDAGQDGRDLYVLQHLKEFVQAATERVQRSQIGELTVVDGGTGENYASALAAYPAAVSEILRQTGKAIGVDMVALLASDESGERAGAR